MDSNSTKIMTFFETNETKCNLVDFWLLLGTYLYNNKQQKTTQICILSQKFDPGIWRQKAGKLGKNYFFPAIFSLEFV